MIESLDTIINGIIMITLMLLDLTLIVVTAGLCWDIVWNIVKEIMRK